MDTTIDAPTRHFFWVRALYDFVSSSPLDLTFREGDVLSISSVSPVHGRHWWAAGNIMGEKGYVPSNYVQVLPQYSGSTLTAEGGGGERVGEIISAESHESSSEALLISFKVFKGANDSSGKSKGESAVEVSEKSLVKTIGQVAQFAREVSRVFPEAGLPLDLTDSPQWTSLLTSLHRFNSLRDAPTSSDFLSKVAKTEPLNPLLLSWLVPPKSPPSQARLKSRSVVSLKPAALGIEALVLHAWEGDTDNGELPNLSIGDHIIVVHEQSDWAYCRRSPESSESGYVPLMYLRKIGTGSEGGGKVPPLPPHIGKGQQSGQIVNVTPDEARRDSAARRMSDAGLLPIPFSLKTTSAFDELIERGLTVEIFNLNPTTDATVGSGVVVAVECTAMKWQPSSSLASPFASTKSDPNYDKLTFVTGQGQVTEALNLGLQRFNVGDEGVIVASPEYCYGEAGLAGLVNSKSYCIYEVKVISCDPLGESDPDSLLRGPPALLIKRAQDIGSASKGRQMMPTPTSNMTENVEGRESMSTADLIEEVKEKGLIVGIGGGAHDSGEVNLEVRTSESLERDLDSSKKTPPKPLSMPPPVPEAARRTSRLKASESTDTIQVPTSSNATTTPNQTPTLSPVTPPPPPPPDFREKVPGLTNVDTTNSTTAGDMNSLPKSPSDLLLSPVSQILGRKGSGGRGGGMRNLMMKKAVQGGGGTMPMDVPVSNREGEGNEGDEGNKLEIPSL